MKNTLLPRTNTVLTRRYFLGGLGAAVALPLCDAEANGKSRTVLRERWRVAVDLYSPTNVVIGRLGKEARLCIQGTHPGPPRRSAGIEVLVSRQGVPAFDAGSSAE